MKRLLFLLMAMFLSVVVSARPSKTLSEQVLACRDIVPDAARLICFDRMAATVAPARAAPAARMSPARVSPAPESSRPAAPAVKDAVSPQRTFGLSQDRIAAQEASAAGVRVKELSHITARLVRVVQAPGRGAIFDLDNGQVWQQSELDGTDIFAKGGDSVEISRGLLGSYWLVTPSSQRFKVIRLR